MRVRYPSRWRSLERRLTFAARILATCDTTECSGDRAPDGEAASVVSGGLNFLGGDTPELSCEMVPRPGRGIALGD